MLSGEQPYLLFPLGETDQDDPEDIVTFFGFLPKLKYQEGAKHRRGRVTVDFFDLSTREELIRARAAIIVDMWERHEILKEVSISAESRARARSGIDRAIQDESPHANCARAFNLLCLNDPESARRWYEYALPHTKKVKRRELLEKLNQIKDYFQTKLSIRSIFGW